MGVKTLYARTFITHTDYQNCLFNSIKTFAKFSSIQSVNHQLHTQQGQHTSKVALGPHDDKRNLLYDGHTTHAYGHYKICNLNI